MIEGQGAWEGRGSGFGLRWRQVRGADIRPVSRASSIVAELLTIVQIDVRNRRLPFCATHCHRQPGGSGSFVGLGGGRGNYQLQEEQIGEDDLQRARGAGFNRL